MYLYVCMCVCVCVTYLTDAVSVPGSDVNKTDEQGLTALHWACANGQMSTVEFLIHSKADINLNGNNGENALLLASCYGYREIVKLLLQHGMDMNYVDEVRGCSLTVSMFGGHDN